MSSAQVTTGVIAGVVVDPVDSRVPAAQVRLLNEGTGKQREVAAQSLGQFRFEFLELGVYTLEVQATGFKTERRTGIRLDRSGQFIDASMQLAVGDQVETVAVAAEYPLLNLGSAEQRESQRGDFLLELPVNRRDLTNIIDLGTGIQSAGGGRFVMNGLGAASFPITQDGTDATADYVEPSTNFSGGFNTINLISMEAIEEVQVSKGVLGAENGRMLSGNLNVVTKSGTNEFHGSGFYLKQDEALNARDPFLSRKGDFKYDQFGGSIGGPIIKNRVFFFTAAEWVRSDIAAAVSGTVPTQTLKDMVPGSLPTLKYVLDQFPTPTESVAPGALVGLYTAAGDQSVDDVNFNVKADAWLTQNMKLTGNYNFSNPQVLQPSIVAVNSRTFTGKGYRVNANLSLFSSRWNSETRFGFNRPDQERADAYFEAQDGDEDFVGGRRFPGIRALGFELAGELRQIGDAPQWSFDQKVAASLGDHSLKFVGMLFRQQYGRVNLENPRFDFGNVDDLLANQPSSVRFTFGTPKFRSTVQQFGLYLQDDWKANDRLTLNIGLRYDYFGAPSAEGEDGGPPHHFNPDGFDPGFVPRPFRPVDKPYEPSALNLAPRFGFAYRPGQKWVVRGGYGIMFAPLVGSISRSNIVMVAPDFPFRVQYSKAQAQEFGVGFDKIQFNEQALDLVSGVQGTTAFNIINPNIKAPYSQNISLLIERELLPSLMLETGFVGTRGSRFIVSQLYNEPDRITGQLPNPNAGTARYVHNADSTSYYSWQTAVRKRFADRYGFNVYYTWGKALSYGKGDVGSGELDNGQLQGFNELGNNRGPSDLDIKHDFKWDAVYEVPSFRDRAPVMRWLLGGWQVSTIFKYRSGLPFTVIQGGSAVGTRPDYVLGTEPIIGVTPGLVYLNRDAFSRVPMSPTSSSAIRPGTLGRNSLRGPTFWNTDLSLARNFRFAETMNLQVRADFLNAFNHRTYNNPVVDFNNGNFGRITSGGRPRGIQLYTRFTF
jgi:outer membrane receptor protein involved in Fe transport